MAYANSGQKQQLAQEWRKLQEARFRQVHGQTGAGNTNTGDVGSSEAAAYARQKAAWLRTPMGQYWSGKGTDAAEMAFRKKQYGGYRLAPGSSANSARELNLYLQMTGQRNPYSSGGGTNGTTTKTMRKPGDGGGQQKDPLFDFLGEWQAKNDEANAANESRYQDIMGQYQDRYDRGVGYMEDLGASQTADAIQASKDSMGAQLASLAGRGLGSRGANYQARSDDALQRQKLAINANVAQLQSQNDARLSADKLQFMERRTDQAPDYAQMMAAAEKYGLGNGGQGFGYSGGGYSGPQQSQQGNVNLQAIYDLQKEPTYGVPTMAGGYTTRRNGPVGGLGYQKPKGKEKRKPKSKRRKQRPINREIYRPGPQTRLPDPMGIGGRNIEQAYA